MICDHVGRYELPVERADPNVRLGLEDRPRRSVRARARRRGGQARPTARCGARAHGADLPHACRTALQAAADPARPLVHALERRPSLRRATRARGCRSQRRPAVVPAREPQGEGDRPRDRRQPDPPADRAEATRRAAAAPRSRPHDRVEGLHDDAGRARARDGAGPRRDARDPWADHDDGGGGAPRGAPPDRRREPRPARPGGARAARLRATRSRGCWQRPTCCSARLSPT